MFDELLKNNSHVKDICRVYKIDIDGDHGILVKAIISMGDLGQSADLCQGRAGPLLAVCADRPYFLEVAYKIIVHDVMIDQIHVISSITN